MRKFLMICAVALMAVVGTTQAQNNNRQRMSKEDMSKMLQKRAESQAKMLKLSDSEKEVYVKTAVEYLTKEMEIRQSGAPKAEKKEDNKKTLTDAEAEEQIEKNFKQEEEQLKLKREYYQKMKDAGFKPSQLVVLFGRQINRMNNNRNRNNNNNFNGGPGEGFGGPGGGFGGPGGGGFGGGF